MNNKSRRQLTLFINKEEAKVIESIRVLYNPVQRDLIDSHVTLCREDEIATIDKVISNLENLKQNPITIEFGKVKRFENGKGVLIPATNGNENFQNLRRKALKGLDDNPRRHEPHITLMHPANSTCTDTIFETLKKLKFPSIITFNNFSLIEQVEGGKWTTLMSFDLHVLH